MIGLIFKSTLGFCASYIVLSFQFNNVFLFEHINNLTGPVGENIQTALGDGVARTWEKTKDMSGQVFTNSEPQSAIEDEVAKTQSALKKGFKPAMERIKKPVESYLEELKSEERDGLSKLIESDLN